jgi:complement component 1 Q subcomponent-binding protein
MAYIAPGDGESDGNDEDVNQFFLHVDVSKPGQDKSLHFLCGLYTDALGIHSVSLRPKLDGADFLEDTTTYAHILCKLSFSFLSFWSMIQ